MAADSRRLGWKRGSLRPDVSKVVGGSPANVSAIRRIATSARLFGRQLGSSGGAVDFVLRKRHLGSWIFISSNLPAAARPKWRHEGSCLWRHRMDDNEPGVLSIVGSGSIRQPSGARRIARPTLARDGADLQRRTRHCVFHFRSKANRQFVNKARHARSGSNPLNPTPRSRRLSVLSP